MNENGVDLAIAAVRLVADGDVALKNAHLSRRGAEQIAKPVKGPIPVTVLLPTGEKVSANDPRGGGELADLPANATASIDVRMPASANVDAARFDRLVAAVETPPRWSNPIETTMSPWSNGPRSRLSMRC